MEQNNSTQKSYVTMMLSTFSNLSWIEIDK